MAAKTKNLIVESADRVNSPLPSSILTWLGSTSVGKWKLLSLKLVNFPLWHLRGYSEALKTLWTCSTSTTIFFDGASKGNPGIFEAGGLVFSPDNLSDSNYSWGLGNMLNNQAKFYNLLMACQIAKKKGYKAIHIFDDCELLIKFLNSSDLLNKSTLNSILQII